MLFFSRHMPRGCCGLPDSIWGIINLRELRLGGRDEDGVVCPRARAMVSVGVGAGRVLGSHLRGRSERGRGILFGREHGHGVSSTRPSKGGSLEGGAVCVASSVHGDGA